ncbi:MAG TPA: hypothetical protein VFA50_21985 [Stellaceae bacterium]|nr:hypothetical protein [Stellaceae bacterium]
MAVAQKFLFDNCFDGPAAGALTARPGKGAAEPVLTRAELAAAEAKSREEGYAAGHAKGRAEAVSAHEERLAAALAAIAERLSALLEERASLRRESEKQTIELTRLAIAKLFPALTRRDGFTEIAALLKECLAECIDEPRLALRLPDALFEEAQRRIAPLAANGGFAGKLVILADEALTGADCRVEWADGGAERDTARTLREIEAAMARAIAGLSQTNDTPEAAAGGNEETVNG